MKKVVLLRHGESVWNKENRFTGWTDVPLNDLLESEAALRNSKNDLQLLAGRLISAQEEELRRLSRELHDDLTQRLSVLAIKVGCGERILYIIILCK